MLFHPVSSHRGSFLQRWEQAFCVFKKQSFGVIMLSHSRLFSSQTTEIVAVMTYKETKSRTV